MDHENAVKATQAIEGIVSFAVRTALIEEEDRCYARNRLLDAMRMDAPEGEGISLPEEYAACPTLTPMLETLEELAVSEGIIEDSADDKDRFGARLAGCVTPAPAEVRAAFAGKLAEGGPLAATEYFYDMSRACDYIRVDRIARNVRFMQDSPAGELEITINLTKPEKDPKDIARELTAPKVGYPLCMLCVENPGYAGRVKFPARFNHRMVPLTLDGCRWYLQYSPYAYYDEHCIVLNEKHTPMAITPHTFIRLFDFVDMFPHYFLGSNADLPVVGGSILNHDHFQGGRHSFPMDRAGCEIALKAPAEGVSACIVNWPMSCVRLSGRDRRVLEKLAGDMLAAWRGWSDEALGIFARTDAPHNTITPIAHKDGDTYTLDLVLRNNRKGTDEATKEGIFHPHSDLHHIKKENIGLIEVMGLFILPGRLKTELDELSRYLTGEIPIGCEPEEGSPLAKHYAWVLEIAARTGTDLTRRQAEKEIHNELGVKCARVLADAGVYKQTAEGREGFVRFLRSIGYEKA